MNGTAIGDLHHANTCIVAGVLKSSVMGRGITPGGEGDGAFPRERGTCVPTVIAGSQKQIA